MKARMPRQAMILAAGLGKRMLPLTLETPKPLVKIAGKPLIDYALDKLVASGIDRAVVNVHHLAGQLVEHLAARENLSITISDETSQLLDSGGGVVKALGHLENSPFFILNSDTFWIGDDDSGLRQMQSQWDPRQMDMLLLVVARDRATGYDGRGDFRMDRQGRLTRARGEAEALIYAGAALVHPRIFADAGTEPHSLNLYFDRAIASGRLFGTELNGDWITVGTPDAILPAETVIARRSTRAA